MERVILHSDLNNFYASVECLHNPSIRSKPVIVCGRTEDRHGVVLAKNNIAKSMGIVTGEPVIRAREKCREAVEVHPDFGKYLSYSKMASEIYSEYTDRVEGFGIDECWLDLSGGLQSGNAAANDIRRRIKKETGLTVSVGVSFNKIFAKLGSDMKKPDAVTVISRENFREKVWRLPAEELFGVGPATKDKLNKLCIHTIGDLASAPLHTLKYRLGKAGETLHAYANGLDTSPVMLTGETNPIKSVSKGVTPPSDLVTPEQVKRLMFSLSEEVCAKLRENGLVCAVAAAEFRFTDLSRIQRQIKLPVPTDSTRLFSDKVYEIYLRAFPVHRNLRSLSVRAAELSPREERIIQTDLFGNADLLCRQEAADRAVDALRARYGADCVRRGNVIPVETDPHIPQTFSPDYPH